jgi:Fic family protein
MTSGRAFERTHSHISFDIHLEKAPYIFWMLLGEAQSKIEHIAGVPLRPDVAKKLHGIYLAKGALATTAIEGNTLSEDEVIKRIEGKLDLPPSREYLGQEIDNIVEAANAIFAKLVSGEDCRVNFDQVVDFNRQVLRGLALDEGVRPGAIRAHDVGVGRYHGMPHQDCEYLLRRMCDWLNDDKSFISPPGQEIAFAIIKAIVTHLYIAWIHPFGDGNGRTARLTEFQILANAGVPLPAAHLLSDHYNRTRTDYYRHLDMSSKGRDGVLGFLMYAVQGFVDSLREQLDLVRHQQMEVAWRNYIHETLSGSSNERRRHLVLDLAGREQPVPVSELSTISGRVARDYIGVSERTLARDVKQLESEGYLRRIKGGVAANTALITAFLPARRLPESTK